MKYKLCSYELRENEWTPACRQGEFLHGPGTFTKPDELSLVFGSKEEADNHALEFLLRKGVDIKDIEK